MKKTLYWVCPGVVLAAALCCENDIFTLVSLPNHTLLKNLSLTPAIPFNGGAAFDAETADYTVILPPNFSEQVKITAEVVENSGHTVAYYPAQSFVPEHGNLAVVTVSSPVTGKSKNYYITFARGPLSHLRPARLSGIMLSVGSVSNFLPDTLKYNVTLPYGTQNVRVFPAEAQERSYFTYTPAASVEISGGTGQVSIGVLAEGCNENTYILKFQCGLALSTALSGISLSIGSITGTNGVEAAFQAKSSGAQYITVPTSAQSVTVMAIKKSHTDTVSFGETVTDGAIFTAPLANQTFTITVNGGAGYAPQTYTFTLRESDDEPAVLTNLEFSVADVDATVFKRAPQTGGNGGVGFSGGINQYNLNFNHGAASAVITATAPEGVQVAIAPNDNFSMIINGQTAAITVTAPSALYEPVQITVSGAGFMPNTYSVFFKKVDPPAAELSALGVRGAASILPAFSADNSSPRTVTLYAGTTEAIVVGTPANPAFSVSYNPSMYATAPFDAQTISVRVSGGPDYVDTVYQLTFVAANQP
jgi:hypothetical protein